MENSDIDKIKNSKNVIIITSKLGKDFSYDYVEIKKLEEWQIKDYVYTQCKGVDELKLDNLLTCSKYDIYRLDQECSKLSIFQEVFRDSLFELLDKENAFSDMSDKSIFDFSNAIQIKDIEKLKSIYSSLKYSDIDPLGLVSLLVNNFRKMISVWCSSNPTEESTGIKSNQLYAIKRMKRSYTYEELIESFKLLNKIDFMIKNGLIDSSCAIDYVLVNLLI